MSERFAIENVFHDFCERITNCVPACPVKEAWNPIISRSSIQVGVINGLLDIFFGRGSTEDDIVCISETWQNFLKQLCLGLWDQISINKKKILDCRLWPLKLEERPHPQQVLF